MGELLRNALMSTSKQVLFPLALALEVGLPAWGLDCQQLQEQRDQRAQRAMAAEVALVHSQRQKLCPQLEALATSESTGSSPQLDYGAYIRCRQQAEADLVNSRRVLYRNTLGFTFLTVEGARLAREADGMQQTLSASCSATLPPAMPSLNQRQAAH